MKALRIICVLFLAFYEVFGQMKIAAFYPNQGPLAKYGLQHRKAIELAVKKCNDAVMFAPGITLEVIYCNSSEPLNMDADMAQFTEVLLSNDILAVIGPFNSASAFLLSGIAGVFSTSVITGSATSPELSDRENYPLFGRTVPNGVLFAKAIVSLSQQNDWKRIALFGVDNEYGHGFIDYSKDLFDVSGIQTSIRTFHISVFDEDFTLDVAVSSMKACLQAIIDSKSSIIVYNGLKYDAQLMLMVAIKMDMFSSSSVQMIFTEDVCDDLFWHESSVCDEDCVKSLKINLAGSICVGPGIQIGTTWLKSIWNPSVSSDKLTTEEKEISGLSNWQNDNLYYHATFSYDAIILMAQAIRSLCEILVPDQFPKMKDCFLGLGPYREQLYSILPDHTLMDSASGYMKLDSSAERIDMVEILNCVDDSWKNIGSWIPKNLFNRDDDQLFFSSPPIYPGNSKNPISSEELRQIPEEINMIALGFCALAVVATIIAFIIVQYQSVKPSSIYKYKFLSSQELSVALLLGVVGLVFSLGDLSLAISPPSDLVWLSNIFTILHGFPWTCLFTLVGAKAFRVYKVAGNIRMSAVKFGTSHTRSLLTYVMTAFFIGVIWIGLSTHLHEHQLDESDDHSMFISTYEIQHESKPYIYHSLAIFAYEKYKYFLEFLAVMTLSTFFPAASIISFSYYCYKAFQTTKRKKSDSPIGIEAEFQMLLHISFVCDFLMIVLIVLELEIFFHQENSGATPGFDNDGDFVTFGTLLFLELLRFIVWSLIWILLYSVLFISRSFNLVKPLQFTGSNSRVSSKSTGGNVDNKGYNVRFKASLVRGAMDNVAYNNLDAPQNGSSSSFALSFTDSKWGSEFYSKSTNKGRTNTSSSIFYDDASGNSSVRSAAVKSAKASSASFAVAPQPSGPGGSSSVSFQAASHYEFNSAVSNTNASRLSASSMASLPQDNFNIALFKRSLKGMSRRDKKQLLSNIRFQQVRARSRRLILIQRLDGVERRLEELISVFEVLSVRFMRLAPNAYEIAPTSIIESELDYKRNGPIVNNTIVSNKVNANANTTPYKNINNNKDDNNNNNNKNNSIENIPSMRVLAPRVAPLVSSSRHQQPQTHVTIIGNSSFSSLTSSQINTAHDAATNSNDVNPKTMTTTVKVIKKGSLSI